MPVPCGIGEATAGPFGFLLKRRSGPPEQPDADRLDTSDGDRTEFVTISLWDSFEAIEAFAGPGGEVVFYPEDDRFLIERESFITHSRSRAGSSRSTRRKARVGWCPRIGTSPCART